jgi:uncharacterized membrane-anchored protein
MKKIIITILTTLFVTSIYAQEFDSTQWRINQIEQSLEYKTGVIELESGNATVTVPKGFQFLDKTQSIYVLTDLWGNPPDSSVLGMLVPENKGVLSNDSWVFTISFDEMGYVKDDDAEDIDYDDLLEEQQNEMKEANPERIKQGYQPIDFVGWASDPHYDKDKKILHWAKELKFGEDSLNTLNYNLRVLGRKGIFMLNAIASMKELPEVQSSIDNVIASVEFKDGHKYSDYIPDVDNVAAWTIGGLVAGKILAKAGFFVVLLKFWKVIALAVTGGGAALWRKLSGRRKEDEIATGRDNSSVS